MTIRPGQEWGTVAPCPGDLVMVDSDAELSRLLTASRAAGVAVPPLGLSGGDLFRALGGVAGSGRLVPGAPVAVLPVDVLRVVVDGDRTVWAAAHVVARVPLLGSSLLGWWRGPIVALVNAQFVDGWDVAPRAHPNDGRVDIVTVDAGMPMGERWKARRRLPTGTHVPHPAIATRQARSTALDLAAGAHVWIDGVAVGAASHLAVDVEPDAVTVHV